MASSNAIGSGSVILSANADALTAGLDKAAGKVDQLIEVVKDKLSVVSL